MSKMYLFTPNTMTMEECPLALLTVLQITLKATVARISRNKAPVALDKPHTHGQHSLERHCTNEVVPLETVGNMLCGLSPGTGTASENTSCG